MIRYQINDIVELTDEKCECGSAFQMISKIHGRSDDVFQLLDNQGEIKHLFPDYVRRSINQSSQDIIEYQAIQKKRDLIEIRLILKENANREEIQNQILKNLQFWVDKIGANLGKVVFTLTKPEKHPVSMKLIRVIRRLEDENS
jgi:phenylacetate-coenzyme A ligase PaaK-like adenylate-forming protein